MSAPYDAILGYHLNPWTCGVAKANAQLAAHWGIPVRPLGAWLNHVLVSVKPSELQADPEIHAGTYDLWLHGPLSPLTALYRGARQVFHAHETGVPSLIARAPARHGLQLLLFGMAHKVQTARLARLRGLLEGQDEDYTINVSTAVHEGSPWDEVATAGAAVRAIFGDHTRELGFLADASLTDELARADVVVLFYDPALRKNNTTFWAALEAQTPVITNLDRQSPEVGPGVYDIDHLSGWPAVLALPDPRACPTWEAVAGQMTGVGCQS